MSQFLVLCALMAVIFVQLAQAQLLPPITIPPVTIPPITIPPLPVGPVGAVCPAGYFANLLSCYACPRGSTSAAGVTCTVCPVGMYSPGAGSASCFACPKGTRSTPAGEACSSLDCSPSKTKTGKRSLREEIEEEAEAESMFSF